MLARRVIPRAAIAEKIKGVKFFCANLVVALLLVGSGRCLSQGFINLNFEQANVSDYSPGSTSVPTSDAFPGWEAYFGSGQVEYVWYDEISIGGNGISLWDANSEGYYPIAGQYSAALFAGPYESESISQTGTVPNGTESLTIDIYDDNGPFSVSLGGQTLDLVALSEGSTPDYPYTVYGADISAFAGLANQQLTITSLAGGEPNGIVVDNIQFSTSPVPEPDTLALCALGGLSLALRWRKKSSA